MKSFEQGALRFVALGTGTSQGVPVIGCTCDVCTSDDPRDRRFRSSALIEYHGLRILIDAGPDLRLQLLRSQIDRVDALLFTHEHQDHTAGLDELRPLYFKQNKPIAIYCTERVEARLRQQYAYIFENHNYPGIPQFNFFRIEAGNFQIGQLSVEAIPLLHASLPVLGFRFGDLAYLTDFNKMGEGALRSIAGVRVLIVSALHRTPHHSHLHLDAALELGLTAGASSVYFTHISHRMGLAADLETELPAPFRLLSDGEILEL